MLLHIERLRGVLQCFLSPMSILYGNILISALACLSLCCSWPRISWTFETTGPQCDCLIVNIYANDNLVQGVTLPWPWEGPVDCKVNTT